MSRVSISKVLSNAFPFLEERDVNALTSICTYTNTPKKKVIVNAGTVDDSLFYLIEGMIRGFFINNNGEEKNIFLRPKNTLSGAPDSVLIKNNPTKYSFEAMPKSKFLTFTKSDLDELIPEYPNLGVLWINGLHEVILTLVQRIESLIDHSPEERYENLLELSPIFFQKAYNKHIANYLGMTSVSLSRIIKRKSLRKN